MMAANGGGVLADRNRAAGRLMLASLVGVLIEPIAAHAGRLHALASAFGLAVLDLALQLGRRQVDESFSKLDLA